MKYGIDYEGVIADTSILKAEWIRKNLNKNVPGWETNRTDCVALIGLSNYKRMALVIEEETPVAEVPPVPGAVSAIRELALKGQLYMISARRGQCLSQAIGWLRYHGIYSLFTGFESGGSTSIPRTKEDIARERGLDVLIDDDLRHLGNISIPLRRLLLRNGCPSKPHLPEWVEYASSWPEALLSLR